MSFSMRINFVDVVVDNSLKNIKVNNNNVGYQFDIRLSYYRGIFLSCTNSFKLTVDNEEVPNELISFKVNNKEFFVNQLQYLTSEFWNVLEPATIVVNDLEGIDEGEHDIKVNFYLRVPYLPLPGGEGEDNYVPLNSSGEKILSLSKEASINE